VNSIGARRSVATTATPFDSFASQKELAGLIVGWPAERLVAIWNSLPGVTPVKRFKDRTTAATRIWKNIRDLGETVKPNSSTTESRPGGGLQRREFCWRHPGRDSPL
jgi:hypothetical protein